MSQNKVKSSGVSKKDRKLNEELRKKLNGGSTGPWGNPNLSDNKELTDVMSILSPDPISIAGLDKNKFSFYTTKTDISLKDKDLVVTIPFDKAIMDMVRSQKPKPFLTINKFCMLWFGLRGADDGIVDLAIVDEAVKDLNKSVEMAWRGRAGNQWGCIGAMNHYIAREDAHHLKLYLKVTSSDVSDAIIARVLFLWGVEETDIPIQTKSQNHFLTNFTPKDPESYANLKNFKSLVQLLVGETAKKILPETSDLRGETSTTNAGNSELTPIGTSVIVDDFELSASAPPYELVKKELSTVPSVIYPDQEYKVGGALEFCQQVRNIRRNNF